ncbi:MAG: PaaX family transcriptional regulator C-terminal domain-containing protein [Pseudomonadota bacterium]
MSVTDPIADLIHAFHARTPPRVWSLIVTIFGDLILPRGGVVGLTTLADLCALMEIGGSALRPAMSRLTADGLLVREKYGRNTFYRLSADADAEFRQASETIYASGPPNWDGTWTIALLTDADNGGRAATAKALTQFGFGQINAETRLKPGAADISDDLAGAHVFSAQALRAHEDHDRLIRTGWQLDDLAASYRTFLACFSPLAENVNAIARHPNQAIVARTLLIHDYRRIVLTDPMLPEALLPKDWPGTLARAKTARLYAALAKPSETWLDKNATRPDGPMPPVAKHFQRRFKQTVV